MNIFKQLFNALLADQQKKQKQIFIARHLAKVALYESEGLESLLPDLKKKIKQLEARMEKLGKPIKVFATFRTAKKQDGYYAKGRTKRGRVITNARGLQSYHNYGLAVDVVFKRYWWSPPSQEWWPILGEEGEKLGLEWGGRWKSKDYSHFQYRPSNVTWKELKPYFYEK